MILRDFLNEMLRQAYAEMTDYDRATEGKTLSESIKARMQSLLAEIVWWKDRLGACPPEPTLEPVPCQQPSSSPRS